MKSRTLLGLIKADYSCKIPYLPFYNSLPQKAHTFSKNSSLSLPQSTPFFKNMPLCTVYLPQKPKKGLFLLDRLSFNLGVSGLLLSWFKSNLCERTQCASYNLNCLMLNMEYLRALDDHTLNYSITIRIIIIIGLLGCCEKLDITKFSCF